MTSEEISGHLKRGGQILKVRNDPRPMWIERIDSGDEDKELFRLAGGTECSWAKAEDSFGTEKLRHRVEPWLTALAQSEHLSLLIGSGLTQNR